MSVTWCERATKLERFLPLGFMKTKLSCRNVPFLHLSDHFVLTCAGYGWHVGMHSLVLIYSVLSCQQSVCHIEACSLGSLRLSTTHLTTIWFQSSPAPLNDLFVCQEGLTPARLDSHKIGVHQLAVHLKSPVLNGTSFDRSSKCTTWEPHCKIVLPLGPYEPVKWFHRSMKVLKTHVKRSWGESASHQACADLEGQICFQTH